ncbi:hypothetical protein BJX99DRAFT_260204 [Aspergillus californicus]
MAVPSITPSTIYPFPTTPHPLVQPPAERPKDMKVLALGMPRTGTMSLYVALKELGYNCYHLTECSLDNNNSSLSNWNAAVNAKFYGKGKRFKGVDFDKMLWRYDAVTDAPCILFTEELMDAYPDAKIILTNREVDTWVASMERSFYAILGMSRWSILQFLDNTWTNPYITLLTSFLDIWTEGSWKDREQLAVGYEAHYAQVRGVARIRGRKVLEFRVQQGWEPLCRFLGKDVPSGVDFPKVNEGGFITRYHYLVFWARVLAVLRIVGWFGLGYFGVVWVAAWFH